MTRARRVLVLVLLAVAAAACSKSKKPAKPGPTASAAPTPAVDPIVGSWVNAEGQGMELVADGTAKAITGGKEDDLEAKCTAGGFAKVVEECAKITWKKGPSAYFLSGGILSSEGMDSDGKPESLLCECTKMADLEMHLSGDKLEMWENGKPSQEPKRR